VTAYYNDNDPFVCAWLRSLIKEGLIADGEVDERSIQEVQTDDLKGFVQCHLFAGIGGWSYALRLAGWPDDRPVWTASVPCQPLSGAGRRQGHADRRHLWPALYRLIAECQPPVLFGEQVASPLGREWLAGVRADLEDLGYAVGAANLCAAGIGAPHIRQRLFWVADAHGGRSWHGHLQPGGQYRQQPQNSGVSRLADTECHPGMSRRVAIEPGEGAGAPPAWAHAESRRCGGASGVADIKRSGRSARKTKPGDESASCGGGAGRLGDAQRDGFSALQQSDEPQDQGRVCQSQRSGAARFWSASDLLPCLDGKARRVEPGIFPLAHGVPARVGRLRAYGNAIVPQVGAVFVRAFLESS